MQTEKQYNHLYYLRRRELLRQRNKEQKIKILSYYGNGKLSCLWCGESRLACLSIDHINDNGGEHRRLLRKGKGTLATFYKKLEEWGYPEGYQTLCMNCQWVKKEMAMEATLIKE